MIALLGLGVLHLGGALLLSWVTPLGFSAAIRSPSSAWVSLALLYALSLGLAGVPLLVMLAGAAWLARHEAPVQSKTPWLVLGLLGVAVLARPWVPTLWDEFVWLAKARFESLGFGASVAAALNPQEHLIPPGYPPLWPAAVGWLALGRDSLDAHVVAGSLVLLLSAGAALESVVLALGARRPSGVVLAVLLDAISVGAPALDLRRPAHGAPGGGAVGEPLGAIEAGGGDGAGGGAGVCEGRGGRARRGGHRVCVVGAAPA